MLLIFNIIRNGFSIGSQNVYTDWHGLKIDLNFDKKDDSFCNNERVFTDASFAFSLSFSSRTNIMNDKDINHNGCNLSTLIHSFLTYQESVAIELLVQIKFNQRDHNA